jgi:1-acyl-sn-glycerol-3-phosphate acyltransferase
VAVFGMRVRVEGLEHIDATKARIYVCNHVNSIDGFLLYGHLPCFYRGLDQAQHFSWPLWGWFSRRFGNIALDQGGGGRTAAGLRAADAALAAGTSLMIFPEGHRSRDGEFLEFQRGAFRLALRNGVDLVPIVQSGSWEVYHRGSPIRAGEVRLRILQPWTAERRGDLKEEEFRQAVRDEMLEVYKRERPRAMEG